MTPIGDLDHLRELALAAYARERFWPVGPAACILLEQDILDQLGRAEDREAIARGLATAPCPVIGVVVGATEPAPHPECDVVVSSGPDVSAILANIARSPVAAMVLVQVLRATGDMPITDALTVESLAYGVLQGGGEHRAWLATGKPAKPAPAPSNGPAVLIKRDDERLEIRLNRPATLNALSVELRDALCEALQLVVSDATIGAVSILGEGRCFSIGGDLGEFGDAPDPATAHAVRSIRLPAFFLSQCADRVEFKLHGACIGAGIELPAFGRRVVVAKDTFFQLPEIRFGLIPGAGGCVSLPRRIGRQRTAYMALTARRISAAKALQWGLVDAVCD